MMQRTIVGGTDRAGSWHPGTTTSSADATEQRVLRFGMLCPGTLLQEWQADAVRQLIALGDVEAVVLIVDDAAAAPPDPIGRSPLRRALFRLCAHGTAAPSATRPARPIGALASLPTLRCASSSTLRAAGLFSADDVHTVRAFDLDFILYFGADPVRGDMLGAARFGIWAFADSDGETDRREPPCWWAIYDRHPVVGAMLERLTERDDAGIILRKGTVKVVDWSYAKSVDALCFESARWPAQVCRDLQAGVADYLTAEPTPIGTRIARAPHALQLARFAGLTLTQRGLQIARKHLQYDHWRVGVIDAPIHAFLDPHTLPSVRWLSPLRYGEFLADPFAVVRDGRLTVMCERFDYTTQRGTITSFDASADGQPRDEQVSIGPNVHLSYPYLVEHEGSVYCIPETCHAREIALYRAESFPQRWVKVTTLVPDFAGVDATIFQHEGRWWLACVDDDPTPNQRLHLWHAPDLLGPWQPHAGNPVKTDIRSARPAGTPFMYDGALYRPAQDCSREYGGRVVINRVTRLDPRTFREEPAAVVDPSMLGLNAIGIHTISAAGAMTLIDAKWKKLMPQLAVRTALGPYVQRRSRTRRPTAVPTP